MISSFICFRTALIKKRAVCTSWTYVPQSKLHADLIYLLYHFPPEMSGEISKMFFPRACGRKAVLRAVVPSSLCQCLCSLEKCRQMFPFAIPWCIIRKTTFEGDVFVAGIYSTGSLRNGPGNGRRGYGCVERAPIRAAASPLFTAPGCPAVDWCARRFGIWPFVPAGGYKTRTDGGRLPVP